MYINFELQSYVCMLATVKFARKVGDVDFIATVIIIALDSYRRRSI